VPAPRGQWAAGSKVAGGEQLADVRALGAAAVGQLWVGGRVPDAKVKLKQAFEAAKVPVEVELYPTALHGWCIRDMPLAEGKPIYKMDDAEHAWAKLVTLYKGALQS
jgi:dienelactone hydrolase